MTHEPDDLKFSWNPGVRKGWITIVIKLPGAGGGGSFTDSINILSATAREKAITRICADYPGIDADILKEALDKVAADVGMTGAQTAKPVTDSKRIQELLASADKLTAERLSETPEDVRQAADTDLVNPRLIDIISEDLAAIGIVGEETLAITVYEPAAYQAALRDNPGPDEHRQVLRPLPRRPSHP